MKLNGLKLQLALLSLLAFSYGSVSCGGGADDEVTPPSTEDPNYPGGGSQGGSEGGDDSGDGGSDTPGGNTGGTNDQPLSQIQQKEKLDDIACDFLKEVPSTDFQNLKYELEDLDLGYYAEEYDWEAIEEWASYSFEDCLESLGQTTEREDYGYGYYVDYIYDNYKALLLASNFTGKFTAKNGRWVRTNASNLQFEIPSENCVLTLETSGNVKKVYAFNLEDWGEYEYDYSTGVTKEYYDRVKCTIGVPEKIVVSLKVDNVVLIKTTVNINLSDITGERFNIAKSSITASATTELSNGYKFNFSELKYSGNNNLGLNASISKNGKTLISTSLSSKLENIPSYNNDAFIDDDFDTDDFENVNGKDAFVKFDVLGQLQLQGKIVNIRKFANYLSSADDQCDNESLFKSYINQANDLMNVNMYFNNTSVKQASVKLEAFQDYDGWYGYKYWEAEPVIVFQDGSSYSTFEAFFDEGDFNNAIKAFERWIKRYDDMLND